MHIIWHYYNYMSHGLTNRALQKTPHEVILHDVKEVTSERQVITHDQAVTSMVPMVKNGKKYITYLYHVIK